MGSAALLGALESPGRAVLGHWECSGLQPPSSPHALCHCSAMAAGPHIWLRRPDVWLPQRPPLVNTSWPPLGPPGPAQPRAEGPAGVGGGFGSPLPFTPWGGGPYIPRCSACGRCEDTVPLLGRVLLCCWPLCPGAACCAAHRCRGHAMSSALALRPARGYERAGAALEPSVPRCCRRAGPGPAEPNRTQTGRTGPR